MRCSWSCSACRFLFSSLLCFSPLSTVISWRAKVRLRERVPTPAKGRRHDRAVKVVDAEDATILCLNLDHIRKGNHAVLGIHQNWTAAAIKVLPPLTTIARGVGLQKAKFLDGAPFWTTKIKGKESRAQQPKTSAPLSLKTALCLDPGLELLHVTQGVLRDRHGGSLILDLPRRRKGRRRMHSHSVGALVHSHRSRRKGGSHHHRSRLGRKIGA